MIRYGKNGDGHTLLYVEAKPKPGLAQVTAATFYEKRLRVKTESSQWLPAWKRFNFYQRLNRPNMASEAAAAYSPGVGSTAQMVA
jgi:hypothetical protein